VAKRPRKLRKQDEEFSKIEDDIHYDSDSESVVSEKTEKQKTLISPMKSVPGEKRQKLSKPQVEMAPKPEKNVTPKKDIEVVDTQIETLTNFSKETEQPFDLSEYQKTPNIENPPIVDMEESTSDFIPDEIETPITQLNQIEPNEEIPNEIFQEKVLASPRMKATPTYPKKYTSKPILAKIITPKMREGRSIVEGKPENLRPLEQIAARGSEAPPRWQCNMCKRIFSTREETEKHLEQGHMISKTSIYFKNKIKVV